jgi:hypothetical protein
MRIFKLCVKAFILIYLFLLLFLALRGNFLTDDTRFGWGMFARVFYYKIQIYGIREAGRRIPIPNQTYKNWTRGKSYVVLQQRAHQYRAFWKGRALLRAMLKQLAKDLCRLTDNEFEKIRVDFRHRSILREQKMLEHIEHVCS